jgi:flagellar basal-body rod modification protein FlgD
MTPIDATGSSNSASDAADAMAKSTSSMANTNTFLQLLVAQIKNQDPLNPTDSVQYVSQLAQFSELEQVIGVRDDLAKITNVIAPDPTSARAASAS